MPNEKLRAYIKLSIHITSADRGIVKPDYKNHR